MGVSPNRDPFNQKAITEGHHTFWPSGVVVFCYGLLVERGSLLGETLPPLQMATVADGTHPTGMHSCFEFFQIFCHHK